MSSGLGREGAGDGDPLLLPPGQLVRVALGVRDRQVDALQQLGHPRLLLRLGDQLEEIEGSADGLAHGLLRIQGGVRVLEDDLYAPAKLRPAVAREARQPIAFEHQVAAGGGLQSDHGAAQRGLATAALAHDGQGAPAL